MLGSVVAYIVLWSAILTLVFSFLLLWRYRRSVQYGMETDLGTTEDESTERSITKPMSKPLIISTLSDSSLRKSRSAMSMCKVVPNVKTKN